VQFNSDVVIDLIIDDACGQSETGSTNFELISTPILVNPIEDVAGNCFELVDLLAIASGGDGELNYEWISDGEVIGTGNLILFNLLPGMDEILLQITDDCGQSETVSIATEYTGSELVVDLGEDIVANCTEVFYVEAQTQGETGDVLFTWEINGEELVGFTTIAEVVMNSSGTISVTASDDCAFEVTDELFVEVFADPIFGEEVIVDLCMADTVEISIITQGGTGLFTYHWPAGIGSSSESFFFNEPQIFTVEVVDVCDQTIAIPVQITFTEPIAGITTQYLGPGLWHFTSEYTCNSCEYYWDFGDGFDAQGINTDHEYDFALDHLLTLTYINEQGCEAQAYYLVESENTLFIPNSFTPNNDGVNDVFSVVALGFSEFYIRIFNRWGELVFESTKEAETWTGNYQNGDHYVPDGTYVYIVHLLDQKKIPQIINGSVTLFR
jgi:gliding motility-associated-like protein